ncbi:MAG TPA: calcium/sodium antiporter [Kofleriaceae bacterium]|nr:calcium/sodium antiporter [Kofleriaceae bacterium]
MYTTLHAIRLFAGTLILYAGAELLVRGSASLARAFGVKALVIGLTVVAYGTSAPELAVSTEAALDNAQPVVLGNVIGSCAANISLILGLAALIAPPVVDGRIIRREVPILLGSAIAVPVMLRDGEISRVEGAILVVCAILFTIITLAVASREHVSAEDAEAARAAEDAGVSYGGKSHSKASRPIAIILSAAGMALLVYGSHLFVVGARGVAAYYAMSDRVLGMTLIALGTSLPELIGTTMAALRGHGSLAVGSVIGSNLLNVFLVLGVVAYLRPIKVTVHAVDLVGLVTITLLAVLFLRGSRRMSRVEGAILVLAYAAFIAAAIAL